MSLQSCCIVHYGNTYGNDRLMRLPWVFVKAAALLMYGGDGHIGVHSCTPKNQGRGSGGSKLRAETRERTDRQTEFITILRSPADHVAGYAHLPPHRWTTLYHSCARSSASGRSHMRVLPPGTLCPTTSAPSLILSSSEKC